MFRLGLAAALLASVSASALAQEENLQFEDRDWMVVHAPNGEVETGQFEGRDALYIRRGQAWLQTLDLADVVIEFDYASTDPSGFMGVNWRASADGNMEQFYVRPHQSGQPDATQYQPIINGISSWQIHADANDAQAIDLPPRQWTRVRIVSIGDQADIYVSDMDTPLIHVPDMRLDGAHGAFGLFMSDRPWMPDTGVWFSDITVREARDADRVVGTPRETQELPPGLVTQWQVSSPFTEDEIADQFELAGPDGTMQALATEPNGVANLARLSGIVDGQNTVLAQFEITADADTHRLMQFGYSDRIRIFVNDTLVYSGNAGWRARDHRHLGTIGFSDAVVLPLQAGQNTVTAAVSESFGGWGVAAAIADREGLSLAGE